MYLIHWQNKYQIFDTQAAARDFFKSLIINGIPADKIEVYNIIRNYEWSN